MMGMMYQVRDDGCAIYRVMYQVPGFPRRRAFVRDVPLKVPNTLTGTSTEHSESRRVSSVQHAVPGTWDMGTWYR